MGLFPSSFNEKLCETLLVISNWSFQSLVPLLLHAFFQTHFKKWMDAAAVAVTSKPLRRNGEVMTAPQVNHVPDTAVFQLPEVKICSAILNTFHLVPAASAKLLEPLITLVLNGERVLMLEVQLSSCEQVVCILYRLVLCHCRLAVLFVTHCLNSCVAMLVQWWTILYHIWQSLQQTDSLRYVCCRNAGRIHCHCGVAFLAVSVEERRC